MQRRSKNKERKPAHGTRAACVRGKVGFPNEFSAQRRMDEILSDSNTNRTVLPTRVYQCNDCGFWHMTSREDFKSPTFVLPTLLDTHWDGCYEFHPECNPPEGGTAEQNGESLDTGDGVAADGDSQ